MNTSKKSLAPAGGDSQSAARQAEEKAVAHRPSGGLEDQNLTRPAPIDRPPQDVARDDEPEGLADRNITRPAPPDPQDGKGRG
ncbi:hypothetical protein [Noviherbaspirillum massiliense]|uniref:hypothetical protein n=1 Tax=Noviherbaspirillum massiliense TaxID=1465823 RepID=UPI000305F503|nr:hypothetical protein [Noviherbaspirillum massiliense]